MKQPPSPRLAISPRGRPLTVRDLELGRPEKVELNQGRIPGAEALALLLMTRPGWNRVIALARRVGRETRAPVTAGEVADERASEHDRRAGELATRGGETVIVPGPSADPRGRIGG